VAAPFDKSTRRKIAARSGYRCAFPGCGKVTIGPGAGRDDSSMTGSAAHIYSDSDAGPRGDGGLSEEARKTSLNGIWLCAHHSRVIDNNDGLRFPARLLESFRDEHEARIAAEHEGLPIYRLSHLEIGENPMFLPNTAIPLSKVTLIVGNNGTGKSVIFRWIDQLGISSQPYDTPHKDRWSTIEYTATLFAPHKRVLRVVRTLDDLRFFLDGDEVLFNPISMEIINYERLRRWPMLESFLKSKRDKAGDLWEAELDDVDLLAEYMDVNPLVIPRLLPQVGRFVPSPFSQLRIAEGNGNRRIIGDDLNSDRSISLHRASGSMLSRSVLEMQIAMANLTAKVMPTIFLINLGVLHFDLDNLKKYVDYFLSDKANFQVVLSTVNSAMADNGRELGWTILRLSGRAPHCQVQSFP
jgi:hypothetical protein